jgi:hypothetical protein
MTRFRNIFWTNWSKRTQQTVDLTESYTFGPERDEVAEEWRKLHKEELNDLYSSPTIVRVMKSRIRWKGHVALMGEGRHVYRILVAKPEGKGPLERPRRRWEDNIKMNLQEVG